MSRRRSTRLRSARALALAAACGVAGSAPVAAASTAAVELSWTAPAGEPDLVTVAVTGLSSGALSRLAERDLSRAQWSSLLCVVAFSAETGVPDDLPCLLGTWTATPAALHFRPRFPPAPGITLTASFDGSAFDRLSGGSGTPSREARRTIPPLGRSPSTEIAAVFPSAARVPANLLRLYLRFSAPMSAREVLEHVRLVDTEHGTPVDEAFVQVEGGLWDPHRTRLTLLIHPGRMKRGVGPGVALGPVLEEGRHYRLEVAEQARDADGLPLTRPFSHTFEVGPADYVSPDPARWSFLEPAAASAPLIVELAEPADHALLERLLGVIDAAGQWVAGRGTAEQGDRRWVFVPDEPWQPGEYQLVVPATLEDPSGNRPGRRFEQAPDAGGGVGGGAGGPVRVAFLVPPFEASSDR